MFQLLREISGELEYAKLLRASGFRSREANDNCNVEKKPRSALNRANLRRIVPGRGALALPEISENWRFREKHTRMFIAFSYRNSYEGAAAGDGADPDGRRDLFRERARTIRGMELV